MKTIWAVLAAIAVMLALCGGGECSRQDADHRVDVPGCGHRDCIGQRVYGVHKYGTDGNRSHRMVFLGQSQD